MGETTGTTSNKTSKTPTSQESPSPPVSFSDWHAAVQAYYPPGAAPPGYFPPSVGTAPPYPVWSGQPMMPYGAMYPPGMYGHPYAQFGVASPGSGNEGTTAAPDAEGKSSESKGKSSRKRSKERGNAKATSGSAISQSCDSDSEGSSDDNDDEKTTDKKNHEQTTTEASSNMSAFSFPYPGSYMTGSSAMAPMTGMDYWSGAVGAVGAPGKRVSASTAIVPAGPRDGAPAELWIQDERELKRQRRKQSNRESARRSRLRKQMECEELGHRVDDLTVENMKLRADIDKFREEINALTEEHTLYLEQLQQQEANSQQEQEPSSPQAECDKTNSRPRVEQRTGKASSALQNLPEAVAVG